MSTDGELVRLILGSSITTCRTIVRETNYERLLAYEGSSPVFLDRTLPAREVDLTLYINNRDDFLYNHILNRVEDEMNEVLNSACRARAQADQGARGASSEGYQSYNLGEGAFATQAGEAIWEYQCRPVIVTAREADECYLQMPVNYPGQNHSDRWGQDFFLEPVSRLLVTEGISVDCNTKFCLLYTSPSPRD